MLIGLPVKYKTRHRGEGIGTTPTLDCEGMIVGTFIDTIRDIKAELMAVVLNSKTDKLDTVWSENITIDRQGKTLKGRTHGK